MEEEMKKNEQRVRNSLRWVLLNKREINNLIYYEWNFQQFRQPLQWFVSKWWLKITLDNFNGNELLCVQNIQTFNLYWKQEKTFSK